MKVVTNKYGDIHIRWQYDNKQNPLVTKAILEKNREIIKEVSVKRHYKDINNKDLARKFSLDKLLKEEFSGHENLGDRKEIWDTYLTRHIDIMSNK